MIKRWPSRVQLHRKITIYGWSTSRHARVEYWRDVPSIPATHQLTRPGANVANSRGDLQYARCHLLSKRAALRLARTLVTGLILLLHSSPAQQGN
jgi:hypothetical protein